MTVLDDEFFMREALKAARRAAEEDEVPVGAVVVCQNRLIARAHNQTERLVDVTAHAEVLAVTAAAQALGAKYLDTCTLYVTVEPCCMCAGALAWAQLGRLVYGASDIRRGYARVQPNILHPRTEVVAGVLGQECSRLVLDFFSGKRRRTL